MKTPFCFVRTLIYGRPNVRMSSSCVDHSGSRPPDRTTLKPSLWAGRHARRWERSRTPGGALPHRADSSRPTEWSHFLELPRSMVNLTDFNTLLLHENQLEVSQSHWLTFHPDPSNRSARAPKELRNLWKCLFAECESSPARSLTRSLSLSHTLSAFLRVA